MKDEDAETKSIDLDIDEQLHELYFRVNVEGASGPVKSRLVCEGNGVSYLFHGRPGRDNTVRFDVPRVAGMVEGTYASAIEVMVENRYFVPVKFEIRLKRAVKVVAESVAATKKKVVSSVTAVPLVKVGATLRERYQSRKAKQPSR